MTMIAPLGEIGAFRFWCQKILPAVYDDSLSYYELLCKIVQKLNEMIEVDNEQSEAIKIIVKEIEELQSLFKKFIESGFDDYYKEQVEKWIDNHLNLIYDYTIAQIFFRLDDSGYLIVHIPDGWKQIEFSTPLNYSDQTSYGRLCLTYNMEGEY